VAAAPDESEVVRLDKWLWAARLFKTRALAAEAVEGGKVHVNGERVKRAKTLKPGDDVRVRKGPYEYRLTVRSTAGRRVSPKDVATVYEETEESRAARERLAEQHRAAAAASNWTDGRPTKKERRQITKFKRRD
jgi:ribosome-associated heat shock protein Hsp15